MTGTASIEAPGDRTAQGRWLERERPYADLKVLALRTMAEEACNFYRLASPLYPLVRGGAQVEINGPRGITPEAVAPFDVVLCLRWARSREVVQGLTAAVRTAGKVLLSASDDDLLWFGEFVRGRAAELIADPNAEQELKRGLLRLLHASDGFLASTPELARAYAPHVPRTWSLENCLDFGFHPWDAPWPRRRRLEGKLVIGSTRSVDELQQPDFEPLRGALARVLRRYPHVILLFVGDPEDVRTVCERHDLPADRVECLDTVPFGRYPELVAQLDIGLSPLANTQFSRAKSRLKLLDYGARSIPYLASPRAAYSRYHQESGGLCGSLCDTQEEWFTALCRLVEDASLRKQMGEAGASYVRSECSMESNAWRWADVLRQARDLGPADADVSLALPAGRPGRNDPCPCGSGIKRKRCCREAFG